MKNYYQILGCKRGDDVPTIRRAYLALAKQHHPDAGGDPTIFAELAEAWGTLRDDKKRWAYHRLMTLKLPPCRHCDGKGHINKMKGFTKPQPVKCEKCNGSGVQESSG